VRFLIYTSITDSVYADEVNFYLHKNMYVYTYNINSNAENILQESKGTVKEIYIERTKEDTSIIHKIKINSSYNNTNIIVSDMIRRLFII
jgi:hypothetical protein